VTVKSGDNQSSENNSGNNKRPRIGVVAASKSMAKRINGAS